MLAFIAGPCLAILLAGPSWCHAQDVIAEPVEPPSRPKGYRVPLLQPIFTDRPSFSVPPGIIARGHVQFETGYTFSYEQGDPDEKSHLFDNLLRIGLMEQFEFRVEWPTWTVLETHGIHDLGLGFKVRAVQQEGPVPQISFAARLSVPTGDEEFSSDGFDPLFRTIVGYVVNKQVGLFGNLNIGAPTSQQTRFVQVSASTGTSVVLTETIGIYIEYFGFYPRDVATGSGHFLQTGMLYLASYNLQLDARMGAGITQGTDDFFSGVGISWRF